ncbi:MAG: ferrous iron transport protein A [Rhodospirillaceae bacterium]|nr:ferrous iron transport protein A [Rhodospirillaceae bacterium]
MSSSRHVSLGSLNVGESARVVALGRTDRRYREKLLAFGLTPGTLVSVERVAPLGDPLELRVRGFALSLRKGEADAVMVEKEAADQT